MINEPSVVAINSGTNAVLAVGEEAKRMIGRTSGAINAIRPMKNGVIADFTTTRAMLKYFISKAARRAPFSGKPRVIVCVPTNVTEVEMRAVVEAAIAGGSAERSAYILEEPMAAAIGAGLPIAEAQGSMVVDVGGGTTEVAVISMLGIVVSKSLRVAGDDFDQHIVRYARKEHKLAIGERTAEEIKISIGCVFDPDPSITMPVRGRSTVTGLPKTTDISQTEVAVAIAEPVNMIVEVVKQALERTPPELSSDIMSGGIMLTGGGALLDGLDNYIETQIGIPVSVADEPLHCVALGAGIVLENMDALKGVLISSKRLRS
jgi:rod shape-determining protein MreB